MRQQIDYPQSAETGSLVRLDAINASMHIRSMIAVIGRSFCTQHCPSTDILAQARRQLLQICDISAAACSASDVPVSSTAHLKALRSLEDGTRSIAWSCVAA